MQRLIIKNFGPIEDLDMEVKDFMLFIGPQASGKSTIAKAVYFFKSLKEDVLRYFLEQFESDEFDDFSAFRGIVHTKISNFLIARSVHQKGIIEFYYSDNTWVKYSIHKDYRNVEISEKFEQLFSYLIGLIKSYVEEQKNRILLAESQIEKISSETKKKLLVYEIGRKVNEQFGDDKETLFIPAVRTFATVLSRHLDDYKFWARTDYLMREFMQEINSIKSSFDKSLEELAEEKIVLTKEKNSHVVELAQQLIHNILRGDYTFDKYEERLRISEDKYLPIKHISSGQQESLWILLLIYLKILYEKNIFLVIEEPEAHLFPEAQKHIMELVALLFNTTDSQVMITTHSPYILSSVNNLLYAGKLGKTKNGKVNALIDSKLWIDVDRTDAMYVHRPGTPPESIMDREQAMIKVERLDEISEVINAEFDKLMDIEFE